MGDIALNLDASDSDGSHDTKNDTPHTVIISKNENASKSNNSEVVTVDSKSTKTNVMNDIDNTKLVVDKNSIQKKESDTTVDLNTYLRSEFIEFKALKINVIDRPKDKLPPYTDTKIENKGLRHRYLRRMSTKNFRRRGYFSPDNTIVQFTIMNGENIPEDKVVMVYEPETRNFTVKGMFVILMVLHLFTFVVTCLLFLSPPRVAFADAGHFIFIAPLILLITLVLCAACFQYMRLGFCIGFTTYIAFLLTTLIHASLSGFFNTRIFMFMSLSMFFMDIVLVVLGCFTFDYTSWHLYPIAIGSCAIFLTMVIPVMETLGRRYLFQWATNRQDSPVTYVICILLTFGSAAVIVRELHVLLDGSSVELGEDDYTLGGFLMYVSLIDLPIRILRKYGACDRWEPEDDE